MSLEIKPKLEGAQKDLVDPTSNSESQLRKVLYPTYFSREPFGESFSSIHTILTNKCLEVDQWQFYGGDANKATFLWNSNPMSRYSDLFDRNLRSADYVLVEKTDPVEETNRVVQFESQEKPEFVFEKPGFLPIYTGRGK
jgi:hypothetical protein